MSDREQDPEPRIVEPEARVLQGEDDLPRQPAPPLDAYTPEPGPGPGERKAFRALRWALLLLLIVIASIVYAALR